MQSRNYQDQSRGNDDRGIQQASYGNPGQGNTGEYANYGMRDDSRQGGSQGGQSHQGQAAKAAKAARAARAATRVGMVVARANKADRASKAAMAAAPAAVMAATAEAPTVVAKAASIWARVRRECAMT